MANNSWLHDPSAEFGIRMNEVLLEKVRLASRIPVDAQIWADMQVSMHHLTDMMAEQVIFQFESTVFKEKLPPQTISKVVEFSKPVTFSTFVPDSPWQFFKERHRKGKWIGWFIRLFPTPYYKEVEHKTVVRHSQKVTIDLQHSVIYPKAKAIASPSMGGTAIRWVVPEWRK